MSAETVLASAAVAVGVACLIGAVVVVGGLVWMVAAGIRRTKRDVRRPGPADQPHLPEGGAVHESSERREPEELEPREERERLTPHELKGFGNSGDRRSDEQRPRKWSPGSSGSFGSGGVGGKH